MNYDAALDIAERVEKAETDVYNNYCECCVSLEICKERDEVCAEASYWIDGYNQAQAEDEEVSLQEWNDSVDLLACLIELKVRREL